MRALRSIGAFTPDAVGRAVEENLAGTTRWDEMKIVNCATAGTAVVAQHGLGVVPNDIRIQPMVHGNAWPDSDDLKMWSSTIVVFHASAVGRYMVWAGIR